MVRRLEIHPQTSTLILDGVSFCIPFAEAAVQYDRVLGPVFMHGSARAVLTPADAERLIAAGVTRKVRS